ncbi:lysylphosphatidylglycerol synthase domain-containing protein [Mesorhizobium sp. LjNodule214]|uniref:lysylphosphatidylglycerol synthase domain-containing protein n=1 Tax=Mesorhizobium sp. LjNodule214 TaxID=3342252 RepID=UPI003ECF532F
MRLLRYTGIGICLVGLVYFALAIARSPEALIRVVSEPTFACALVVATICTFVSLVCASIGWQLLLSMFGGRRPLTLVCAVFLATQIGKYAPGNIGHLVGRAAVLKAYDVPIGASSKAMLVEVVVLLATGVALVVAFMADWLLAVLGDVASRISITLITSALAIFGAMMIFAAARFRARLKPVLWQLWADLIASRKRLAAIALIDLACFALNGLALFAATRLLFPETTIEFVACLGVATASFLAGYVTPGAPGGIGVREATTILLLGPSVSTNEAALVALTVRLAATVADLIGFVAGNAMLQRRKLS